MRLKVKILVLVSKHETGEKKSRSHLETWDCKIKFSFSSRSTRPRDRNSRSRLEAWDWKEEILDLVSKHETEREKFSILSRELKKASRYVLRGGGGCPFPLNFWKSLSWFEVKGKYLCLRQTYMGSNRVKCMRSPDLFVFLYLKNWAYKDSPFFSMLRKTRLINKQNGGIAFMKENVMWWI